MHYDLDLEINKNKAAWFDIESAALRAQNKVF